MENTALIKQESNVNPFFVVMVVIITAIAMSWTIWKSAHTYQPVESVLSLKKLTPQELQEQCAGVVPPTVKVGLYVDAFRSFDTIKSEFVFEGILSFEFDEKKVPRAVIEKFVFKKGDILERTLLEERLNGQFLHLRYAIQARCISDLNYTFFPLDDHRISFVLADRNASPCEFEFQIQKDDFKIGQDLSLMGWIHKSQDAVAGYIEAPLLIQDSAKSRYYPAIGFVIGYQRSGARLLITIFFPLLALFFLTLFAFVFDVEKHGSTILTLTLSAITGLLAFRFVIESMSPHVGYFMISDYVWFIFFTAIFLIFFFNAGSMYMPAFYKKIFIIFLNIGVFLACFYYLLIWDTYAITDYKSILALFA